MSVSLVFLTVSLTQIIMSGFMVKCKQNTQPFSFNVYACWLTVAEASILSPWLRSIVRDESQLIVHVPDCLRKHWSSQEFCCLLFPPNFIPLFKRPLCVWAAPSIDFSAHWGQILCLNWLSNTLFGVFLIKDQSIISQHIMKNMHISSVLMIYRLEVDLTTENHQ